MLGLKIIERDELIYVCATFKDRFMHVFHFFTIKRPTLCLAINWVFFDMASSGFKGAAALTE